MKKCLTKLENVSCKGEKDCKRKKVLVAQAYITSMNVRHSTETILRGATTHSVFGTSLLFLMKEKSDCSIPEINFFSNKIVALVTKGIIVSIFHDMLTKPSYNYLDDTVSADKMLQSLEKKRHDIQDSCFKIKNFDFWMRQDIKKANSKFTADIQNTNTNFLNFLKMKYPWIHWHVITYHGGSKPISGFPTSVRSHLYSSSEKLNVHSFVIPTNNAIVEKMNDKIKMWTKVIANIGVSDDANKALREVQKQIAEGSELYDQIQSFAFLPGTNGVFGHYDQTIKQHTLGVTTEKSQNVYVHSYTKDIVVAVSFNQLDFPPKCSKRCNNKGECFAFPYSTLQGCRCNAGYSD